MTLAAGPDIGNFVQVITSRVAPGGGKDGRAQHWMRAQLNATIPDLEAGAKAQEPGINNVDASANALVRGSDVEQSELHVANSLRIRFAAGDVELRLIDVRATALPRG